MRDQWNTIIFSVLFFPVSVIAAEEDTIKTYHADEVVVTATRTEISPDDAPSLIQIISSESIQRIGGTSAADVLVSFNGIKLKDYGTVGGTKNITFRGLSTENALFLVNGTPINDSEYGSVDLSLIPLGAIDRMEVSNSSSSALYGGNALGGVVNIITRKASDGVHGRIQQETGSFGANRTLGEIQGRSAGFGLLAGMTRETGLDNFPYLLHRQFFPDSTVFRKNADYDRTQIYLNADGQLSTEVSLEGTFQYINFERGIPGSIDFPDISRQKDKVLRGIINCSISATHTLLWTTGMGFIQNNQLYYDTLDYSYNTKNLSFHSQLEWSLIEWDRFLAGIEYNRSTLGSDGFIFQYDPITWNAVASPYALSVERIQKSTYASNEILMHNNRDWFDKLSIYLTVRYDAYSDVKDDAFSPKAGMNVQINKKYNIHLRSSIGNNFRVPTFNDLFYPKSGNPNLKPERAVSFDAGLMGATDQAGLGTLEVTYFDISTKDKIAYVVQNANYIPFNIGKAENSGLEIRYNYHTLDGWLDAFLGFTFIDAVKKDRNSTTDSTYGKQLSYVPKSMGVLGISFETLLGRVNLYQSISSLRYTELSNARSLPSYSVTNITLLKRFDLKDFEITFQCTANNVFDVDYQTVEGYPMPGRAFRLSIGIDY